MNELLRQRLVGLAVLLLAVFLLSLLLPGQPAPEDRLPAATVSLSGEMLTEADAVPPPDDVLPEPSSPEAPPVDPGVAISALAEAADEAPAAAPAPSPAPAVAALKLAPKVDTAPPPAAPPKPVVKAPPVKPEPKLAERVANAPPVPGWYVQVGSYSALGSAKTVVSLLQKLGLTVGITRITGVKGQPLNRVRAGPYASEAAARSAHAKIAKGGYPQARIVREPSN